MTGARRIEVPPKRTLVGLVLVLVGGFMAFQAWSEGRSNDPDQQIRFVMSLTAATPALKQKLAEALKFKAAWDGQLRDLNQVKADRARVEGDQDRIRKNLGATPREAK